MKIYLFIFLTITAFVESTIAPFPFTLLSVIGLSVFEEGNLFGLSFYGGLLVDILTGRMMGETSLFFLVIAFIISLYRKKIVAHTLSYILPFSALAIVFYNLLFFKKITLYFTGGSLVIGFALFLLIPYIVRLFQRNTKLSI